MNPCSPDKPGTQSTAPNERSDGGFALVISLSLMAIILLLLVALSTQLRISMSAGASSQSEVIAKESARLGFLIALGNLQQAAGPDQRVTTRSDLFYDEAGTAGFARETLPENRFWTGVWDTTRANDYENARRAPRWLVSGENPLPDEILASKGTLLVPGYDPSGAEDFSGPNAFFPVRVETETIEDLAASFAWWVGDEGIKASIAIEDELIREVDGLPNGSSYLDYGPFSAHLLPQNHDPTFPYPLLYEYHNATEDELATLERLLPGTDVGLAANELSPTEEKRLAADALHSLTLSNKFVLSNPIDGGLKKDLSYLKAVDLGALTQAQIQSLYGPVAAPLTPQALQFLQLRGNPTTTQDVRGEPLLFPSQTLAGTEALDSSFTFAPIITEFQLTCGVTAEDGNLPNGDSPQSEIYLVYKLYLDLWNPYSMPMRIGDGVPAAEANSFDLRVEIENLPDATITNLDTGDSVDVDLPDLSELWSASRGSSPGKNIRPGMNFHTTFPLHSGGTNNLGVFQIPLGQELVGSRSDEYEGRFTFTNPLSIRIYAIANDGTEYELCTASIENYPDFTVNYVYNWTDRSSWFKRVPNSSSAWGMNRDSLEVVGYAFGFRFRLLDEQESLGGVNDLSRLLSETDIRTQIINVDLDDWDLSDAWEEDSPLPYDFTSSHNEIDPGFFEPSHGFLSSDFFDYATSGTGRKDRIAKFYELPVSEIPSIRSLRNLSFRGYPTHAVGSPWGGDLNEFFDAFFFSTLPDPNESSWDGTTPLRNPRMKASDGASPPTLAGPDTARGLQVTNGFNLNSTSPAAWRSLLTGRSFDEGSLTYRYERPSDSDWRGDPPWGVLSEPLQNVLYTLPETAPFNLIERPEDPRFELQTLNTEGEDYTDSFSMAAKELNADRQHPAFIQGLREMRDEDLEDLGTEVVTSIRQFAATNNRPPFSMAEFLNAGLLQEAIDAVPSINDRSNDYDRIPRYSPANVNQGTLVAKIAEYSQVRSDTFTIRAFGAEDASGNGLYCEATVQRRVDEVAPAGSPFGRQFEVVSFRWIPRPAEAL